MSEYEVVFEKQTSSSHIVRCIPTCGITRQMQILNQDKYPNYGQDPKQNQPRLGFPLFQEFKSEFRKRTRLNELFYALGEMYLTSLRMNHTRRNTGEPTAVFCYTLNQPGS